MATTFKHSGDMGDILFSLPCIESMGGGILYLDPTGGEEDPFVSWTNFNKTKFNEKSLEFIKPLLEKQSYLEDVRVWTPEVEVDHNLNKFRGHIKFNNLTLSHLEAMGMMKYESKWQTEPWLEVDPKPLPNGKKILLARSCRYHSNYSFWEQLDDEIIDNAVFAALPKEFEYFLYTFPRYRGRVERLETENILDLAGYIAACELFIGNQGMPHAIAEGLKKNMVNEFYRPYPSCIYKRDNVQYV